jgi:hypothetical protein
MSAPKPRPIQLGMLKSYFADRGLTIEKGDLSMSQEGQHRTCCDVHGCRGDRSTVDRNCDLGVVFSSVGRVVFVVHGRSSTALPISVMDL